MVASTIATSSILWPIVSHPGEMIEEIWLNGLVRLMSTRTALLRSIPCIMPHTDTSSLSFLAATVGHHDRRRNAYQQDGACPSKGVRSDARAALGDQHGILRERRRILSLLLLGRSRCRSHRSRRFIRSWMPAYCRGAAVWNAAVAEED